MGQKRGRSEGSFVRETSAQTVTFYRDFVQTLRPWQAPAPKLHTVLDAAEEHGTDLVIVPAWVGEDDAAPRLDEAPVTSSSEAWSGASDGGEQANEGL